MRFFWNRPKRKGTGLPEYALLLTIMGVGAASSLPLLGHTVQNNLKAGMCVEWVDDCTCAGIGGYPDDLITFEEPCPGQH